jgi:hypothetical protein
MTREALQIGIVVERRRLAGPWTDHAWMPVAVLPGVPDVLPWTVLAELPGATRYYAGAAELEFFRADTGTYRDNLRSGQPSLWVWLRDCDEPPGVALQSVTADPAEGEAWTEPGSNLIETVPMPPEIQERLARFVATHHVERPVHKRTRDRADPEALALNPRGKEGRE